MHPVEEIIQAARESGSTMIEVHDTVHAWKTSNDQLKLSCKLLWACRSDRLFLLCGEFAVAIGQCMITHNLLRVPESLAYAKPPPAEDAILVVEPNKIWLGDWYDWLEPDDSADRSENDDGSSENSDKD